MATISLEGVEAGAWGGRVGGSGDPGLVPVVTAKTEATVPLHPQKKLLDRAGGLEGDSLVRDRSNLLTVINLLPCPLPGVRSSEESPRWPPEATTAA